MSQIVSISNCIVCNYNNVPITETCLHDNTSWGYSEENHMQKKLKN